MVASITKSASHNSRSCGTGPEVTDGLHLEVKHETLGDQLTTELSVDIKGVQKDAILSATNLYSKTSVPPLPILEDYPPDILALIFSLMDPKEINLDSPNLAPYYLPIKYKNIELQDDFTNDHHRLPNICIALLPFYLQLEWFQPESIKISSSLQFNAYPCLEKIKTIIIDCLRSTSTFRSEDFKRMSKMKNIIRMKLGTEIPETLPHSLHQLELELREPQRLLLVPLQLQTLEITYGSGLKSWPNLTTLILHMVDIDFLVRLPLSLVYLDIEGSAVREFVNLEYLTNLGTMSIDSLKNVKLPLTLRRLKCFRENDFTQFSSLEVVTVIKAGGNFSFPDTIREINLLFCDINGLDNLSELSKLEVLYLHDVSIDLELLDMKYPHKLTKMFFDIRSKSLAATARFNALPRALKLFAFDNRLKTITKLECIWPDSVRNITLCGVDIKFLEWPLQLEELTLVRMHLQSISSTNIADLSLEVLSVSPKAHMRSAEVLRTPNKWDKSTAPKRLLLKAKELDLKDMDFELSTFFFSEASTLTHLEMMRCKIEVSRSVKLPPTLRRIRIEKCGLTSDMWSNFICPPLLKWLDLLRNELTTFFKINKNMIEVILEGNEIPASVMLTDSVLAVRAGRLASYHKLDEIGVLYKFKKYSKFIVPPVVTLLLVTENVVRFVDDL